MRIRYAVKASTAKGCLPGSLHRWQRLLLGIYVVLFAVVLPFICWGAAAEPGHPHRFPHFVFASPVLADPVMQMEMARSATPSALSAALPDEESHGTSHAAVSKDEATQSAAHTSTGLPIPGRSTPKLMIFSILLLVLLGAYAVKRFDLWHFPFALRHHFPESVLLPVPLQPPRLLTP